MKPQIIKAIRLADEELKPVGSSPMAKRFILETVEKLEARGFEKEANEVVQNGIDREWIEDLSVFPKDMILLAAKRWRNQRGQKRAPYATGELMDMISREIDALRAIASKGNRALRFLETAQ